MIIQSKSKSLGYGDFTGSRVFYLCLITFICVSCNTFASTSTEQEPPTTIVIPTTTDFVDPVYLEAWKDWEAGPHSAGYDLGKGPNTYCARCHSPPNWDWNARIDSPPNCVSCKFDFEESPRIAEGNPLISEDEWEGIGCEVCHMVENGITDPAPAWFDQPTRYYETISSSSQLCEKCHMDTETLKHKRDLGDGAHADFTCTDCHHPHTLLASCNSEDCHPEVTFSEELSTDYSGHTLFHQSVNCVACHDASGLDVGPMEGQDIWTTYRMTELLGRSQTTPYVSHTITNEVVCGRCHFPDNPWDIMDSVSE